MHTHIHRPLTFVGLCYRGSTHGDGWDLCVAAHKVNLLLAWLIDGRPSTGLDGLWPGGGGVCVAQVGQYTFTCK